MATVVIEPLNVTIECPEGESVFAAARRQGVPLPTACAGKGTCGLCRVRILSGEALLPPISTLEKRHLGNTYFITKLRLACQLTVAEDGAEPLRIAIPEAPPSLKLPSLRKGP